VWLNGLVPDEKGWDVAELQTEDFFNNSFKGAFMNYICKRSQ